MWRQVHHEYLTQESDLVQMWEWPRVPASPPKVPKPSLLKSLHADSGPRVCGVGVWRGCCLPLAAGHQDVGERGIDCEFILIFHWEFIPMDSFRDGSNRISPERLARFSPLTFMASLPLLEMLPARVPFFWAHALSRCSRLTMKSVFFTASKPLSPFPFLTVSHSGPSLATVWRSSCLTPLSAGLRTHH